MNKTNCFLSINAHEKAGFFAPGHKNIFRKKPGFSKCIFTVKKRT
ncbi:Uncharacterized protein dnm_078880 [Desulfonema magnum]|uniref:Uncharacterized protein n=1 Tax=Desulfonema magnum TaxID=45655 RepID=A0A975GSA0_9BACT|nr:Uncharacterized protein dnm_078880 [Desulfonema magnum]